MGTATTVTRKCLGCGLKFEFEQRSNFPQQYCDPCKKSRIKTSKAKYLQAQRDERREEQSMKAKLDKIPDFPINPYRLLTKVQHDLT